MRELASALLVRAGMLRIPLCISFLFSLVSSLTVGGGAAASPPSPIVGGTPVPAGRWPEVAAVLLRDGACSGTLVAPDVVLTAGHCIEGGPVEVVLDTVDYARTGGERIRVAWSRAYPDWERRYDVGVVVLDRPAKVTPRPVAARCTARAELVAGRSVTIAGFGLTSHGGTEASSRLHQASVSITDPSCTADPACTPSIAPEGEFVAGGQGVDSCFGDSGGPVYVAAPGGPALLGLVSRGLSVPGPPCGGGGVYVRADRVAAWIERVTGRLLARTSCEELADAPGSDGGGCAAGSGGAGAALGLALLVAVTVARARRRAR